MRSSLLVLRGQRISIKMEDVRNGVSQGFGTNLDD